MPLSDTAIKNAKPADKPYKMQDEKGMYLLVHSNGSKYFRYNYRFDGKRKTLALGTYPVTSLKEARDKRDTAKKQIDGGIDPSENKKAVKASKAECAANSFEIIAREWGSKKVNEWDDKNNRSKRMLERNIFPWLGSRPITDILPKDILACLRRVEDRGTIETAHRTLQICGQVFRYAVATGRADRDITPDLRGALPPAKGEHFASITEPKQVAELLRAIDSYQGSLSAVCALKLAPLVFVRPGELRAAEWQHIDLDAKEWRYFVSKTEVQHIVPLSTQAVAILEELQPLTGHGRFVFSSERTPRGDRCMSENTLNAALKRLGYGKDVMTAHCFRAMARTILDEVLGVRVDFIEHQLAHAVKDPNGRAYNRTAHLPERHKMMQQWADYLDGLKNGAQVLPFKKIG
ncbi:MAG TPA: integrase arm-type DNA-binding domain-containing protein [Methylobacter sp.]|jgi:integrase